MRSDGEMGKMMIKTEKLTFTYEEGGRPVLDNIDIEIERGTFTAVLGRNGSGKSTLSKQFNAILLPTGGKVYIKSMDSSDEKNTLEIRKTVGMVFQNPDNQIVAATVEEDVAFGLENLGVPHDEMKERVEKALKAVGMYDKRKSAPHMLSGGQKQRSAIAGIIAMAPETIVFDEPTAMLDPEGRKEVLETIKVLKNKYHMTIVMITHYMEEAAKADRVLVIDKGRIVMDGVPGEIFSQTEKMKAMGLDVPSVTLLCHELRKRGIDIRGDILRTEECAKELDRLLGGKGERNGAY